MSTRHLVDSELLPIVELMAGMTGVSAESLGEARGRVEMAKAMILANADSSVSLTEHHVPQRGDGPAVRVLLYRPDGLRENAPVVLQIHGGGYVMGIAEMADARNREWAKELDCAIAAVDYRLAPDLPFPAGLDDCYAALEWIHAEGSALGLDTSRVAVCGDSAGGGLAAGLALLARDRGGPAICYQLLIYPMIDDRTCVDGDPNAFTGEFVWTRPSNAFGWESWLGQPPGSADVPYLAAPARATDLSGLPPALIATVALDMFVDEDLDYAKRLIRAGVPTEVLVLPGAFHGFDTIAPVTAISQRFLGHCKAALKRAFDG